MMSGLPPTELTTGAAEYDTKIIPCDLGIKTMQKMTN